MRSGPGYREVVLDRPGRRNVIDAELLTGLLAAVRDAEADPGCRVLVLSAEGPDFCAGMDLAAPVDPAAVADDVPYWTLLRSLSTSELVTVAVVDGAATAGGVGLAAACDLVLAGDAATFRLTEALFGLLPAMALPFVARRTGEQRAFAATLTARTWTAAEALEAGLADRAGASAAQLLRPLLVELRRLERPAVAALKRYREAAFGWPAELGRTAGRAFAERLAAPEVRQRIAVLRQAVTA
ncbi:enoyl-CoA hydratase-related protein [Couchioplanes azureus]|uniref:enoyl-CoA hydratase-related protein n=1 Tax=Couchioplanes caeruleus TaxID=56438 RepID=UPI00188C04FA|nr:enoyl-CoA hydratase-related protein [Couchioplanes caeruleus]